MKSARFPHAGLYTIDGNLAMRNRPLGARHAVWRTLYSRAHRIGVDGASCLSGSLREDAPFNLFMVDVVRMLAKPAFEVAISPEEEFQSLRDDVRRRRINELRIFLEVRFYRLANAGLDRHCLGLFGWCLDNRHVCFSFFLSGLYYKLCYKFVAVFPLRGHNAVTQQACRAGAIPQPFGRL